MAELNEKQLAALDSIIAKMAADKVQAANISADFIDAVAQAVDAVTEVVDEAFEAAEDFFDDIADGVDDLFGNRVVVAAERVQRYRERMAGRPTPSLEELVALRSLYAK